MLLPPVLSQPLSVLMRLASDELARLRLRNHDKLHLACGRNPLRGWANVDLDGPRGIIKLDLTRRLPIASDSMSLVYSEHFIEHIGHRDVQRLLGECHRVLRPGGVLRVSTPDLRQLISEYESGRLDYWADMNWKPATPAQLLNEGLRHWGHQFLFDAAELESLLASSGFSRVERRRFHESPHVGLAGLESRPFHGELIYDCVK